jgi:hypothetical protein
VLKTAYPQAARIGWLVAARRAARQTRDDLVSVDDVAVAADGARPTIQRGGPW